MRMQFPNGSARIVRSERGVKLVRRRLNQNAVYFVIYDNQTIHVGNAKYCQHRYNRYTKALASLGYTAGA
jgi:hypothetical protein